MDTQILKTQIAITGRVMMRNAEGISHEESLKPAAPGASCMNWVAGHLCRARAQLVRMLGQESPFPPEDFAMYQGGSKVPFDAAKAIPFEELLERFGTFEKGGRKTGTVDPARGRLDPGLPGGCTMRHRQDEPQGVSK